MEQEDYKNEEELQELLFKNPGLLDEEKSDLVNIKREVAVKRRNDNSQTGRIDILGVTPSGIITLVEVKLKRNGQSRREVLAQIIDYISILSDYSYYELDAATDGKLSEAISSFENNEELPRTIENNLRNGSVRLIIAVDEANDDLHRIIEFVVKHNFRVDLIEIKKIKNGDGYYYSSNPIVQSDSYTSIDQAIVKKEYPLLDRIVANWQESNLSPAIINNDKSYRQIRINNWPASVHYEFAVQYSHPIVYVRLDNELYFKDPRSDKISTAMEAFVGQQINGHEILSKPYSHNGTGKVLYIPLQENELDQAPAIMTELINKTKSTIDSVLSSN